MDKSWEYQNYVIRSIGMRLRGIRKKRNSLPFYLNYVIPNSNIVGNIPI